VSDGKKTEGLLDGEMAAPDPTAAETSAAGDPLRDSEEGLPPRADQEPEFLHRGREVSGPTGTCRDGLPVFRVALSSGLSGTPEYVFIFNMLRGLVTRTPRVLEITAPIPIISTRQARVLTNSQGVLNHEDPSAS
jgi:hypothetical protein